MPHRYHLKLYIAGRTQRSEQCIVNLHSICEMELRGEYELSVIDVLENPQLAEDDKILATPTLIKKLPPPMRRLIGDLSEKEKVLIGMDLKDL
ncbi:MAG TPA: circadian clock protein KaiB [Thermodesulfovibrionales bacterium]|nr:circadian clock protein KaiB [Thermodesulfovibrionales bacterium]